jgi:hypothetical protein
MTIQRLQLILDDTTAGNLVARSEMELPEDSTTNATIRDAGTLELGCKKALTF